MRNVENHIKNGKTLLKEKEQLRASEIVKLLFDTGLSGTGRTDKLITLANDVFFFGASVGYFKRRKDTMNEQPLTQEEKEILQTLKERPEIVNILQLFNSLPEEDKPAAFEACITLLSGKGTAKELISEYWTRKTQQTAQKAGAVTQ